MLSDPHSCMAQTAGLHSCVVHNLPLDVFGCHEDWTNDDVVMLDPLERRLTLVPSSTLSCMGECCSGILLEMTTAFSSTIGETSSVWAV